MEKFGTIVVGLVVSSFVIGIVSAIVLGIAALAIKVFEMRG
jgi:hypothetical protein